MARLSTHSISPLERLERALSPWVAYVIVPVFALANAGVAISGDALGGLASDPVTVGVGLGLVLGKTIGVFAAVALAVRSGIGRLPAGTTWRHMLGLASCAGIGFTVALFVASLSWPSGHSFENSALADSAKIGILLGSALAGVIGYGVLRSGRSEDKYLSPALPERKDDEPCTLSSLDAGALDRN